MKVLNAKIYASKAGITDEQWRDLRRNGIGGSDAAAIMGVSPYQSAFAVYMDKLGFLPEKEDSEPMRQGRDLEEYVAKRFVEYMQNIGTPKKVKNCNFILQHPKFDYMLANVDRLIVGENAGLECKTTSVYNKTDFSSGDVPLTYFAQCQHYMAVTGAERWYLAILVLNKGFYVFDVQRSEADIRSLMSAEQNFWENNILKRVEPLPSGSEQDGDIISLLNSESTDKEVDISLYAQELNEFMELDSEIKVLDEKKESLKQKIQNYMQDAERAVCENYKVSYKTIVKNSLDSKTLKLNAPEIYNQFVKTSSYRQFKVAVNK